MNFPPVGLSPYLLRKSQALDIHSSKADCSIKGTQPPYRFLTEWANPFKKEKKKRLVIRENVRHTEASPSTKATTETCDWLLRRRANPVVEPAQRNWSSSGVEATPLSFQRRASAGTPRSSDGVVVIHAADASASVTSSRRTDRGSSPRMELSSERAVATLEMSQSTGKGDEAVKADGDYESLPPHVSVVTHMTAGAVAGILEHTVMYPVDSVKVTHKRHRSRRLFTSLAPSAIPAALTIATAAHTHDTPLTHCYRLLTTVSYRLR